jgi:prophage antirepressor-like protein
VLVIMDKEKKHWYKGKDIATVLEYKDTRSAIINNVNTEYKKSYADMGLNDFTPLKIDPQTIFIDNRGLFQLVSRSKKKEAMKLWKMITQEILPKLFVTGTYTLPPTQSDIERLNKSFYDDNQLSDLQGNPLVYLAYVGIHNGQYKLKWGLSVDFTRRDLKEHRKLFEVFNVVGIWKTLSCKMVEDAIKKNFISKNMVTPLVIDKLTKKGITKSTQTEIITLDEINNLDYCLDMIESVVKNTMWPQELGYIEKIKKLQKKHKYGILELKHKHLKKNHTQLRKTHEQSQETHEQLQKTHKQLQKNHAQLQEKYELLKTNYIRLVEF